MLKERLRFDATMLGSEIRHRLEMSCVLDPERMGGRENENKVKAEMLAFAIVLTGVSVDEVKAAHNAMMIEEIHQNMRRNMMGDGHDNQRVG